MTAVVSLPVSIPRERVLRFLGYPAQRQPPARVSERLEAVLQEARAVVRARGALRYLEVEDAPRVGLDPIPAEGLVLGLATAGEGLENRASERLARGDTLGATLYDAVGSAAAEEAADLLSAQSLRDGGAPGEVSCRISPGYGRWHLEAQRSLFALLPCAELGVSLTASLLMRPRKSVSFALWLGAHVAPRAGLSGCAECTLDGCRYRRDR